MIFLLFLCSLYVLQADSRRLLDRELVWETFVWVVDGELFHRMNVNAKFACTKSAGQAYGDM